MSSSSPTEYTIDGDLSADGLLVIRKLINTETIAGVIKEISPRGVLSSSSQITSAASVESSPPQTTKLPWTPACSTVLNEFMSGVSSIGVIGERDLISCRFVYFHKKDRSSGNLTGIEYKGRMLAAIPIKLGIGYPRYAKGSNNSEGIPAPGSAVEVPLELGSILLWDPTTWMEYPPVDSEENSGYCIVVGYGHPKK